MKILYPEGVDSFNLQRTREERNLKESGHLPTLGDALVAIRELEKKVGIDVSRVTTSHDYRITVAEAAIAAGGVGGGVWGTITGTLSAQTDLQAALDAKAPTASPTFTGTITTPLTANRIAMIDTGGVLASNMAVTMTEFGFLSGVSASIQTQISAKEPTITAGTTAQYWRGDKSWQTLNQAAVAGLTTADSPTFAGLTVRGSSPNLIATTAQGYVTTVYQAGVGGGGQNVFQRADGTEGAPTAVLSSMGLGGFSFRGYNGSAWTGSKGFIQVVAAENWSTTANGTYMAFSTTPLGSTTLTQRVLLSSEGNFGLGQNSFGTSAAKVFAIGSGTAPTTSPADAVQMWSADRGATAGKAGLHIRSEDGTSHVLSDRVGLGTVTPSEAMELAAGNLKVTSGYIVDDDIVYPIITVGGSVTSRTFTVNVRKMDTVASSNTRFYLHWWTSTTSYGTCSIVGGPQTVAVTTGTNEDTVSTSTSNFGWTDSSGNFVVTVSNAQSGVPLTVYFHVEVQGIIYQGSGTVNTGAA